MQVLASVYVKINKSVLPIFHKITYAIAKTCETFETYPEKPVFPCNPCLRQKNLEG
jgi:hypothetical protein